MTMLKIFCTLAVLFITLTIFCSTHVESRATYENGPSSHIQFLRLGDDGLIADESAGNDQEVYMHTKRKSELLSALYGLPYSLAYGKRQSN